MKITLHMGGRTLAAKRPHKESDHVLVDAACPACAEPLRVRGRGNHVESHDTYAATAHCVACGAALGTIRVRVSTIFGIEEDERILNGRMRVY